MAGVLVALLAGAGALTTLSSAESDKAPATIELLNVSDEVVESGQRSSAGAEPCTPADEPTNFARFSLGESLGDLPLEAVRRRCVPASSKTLVSENFVSYLYGECDASKDEGICAPPVEIQTWPACERSLSSYEEMPGVEMPHSPISSLGKAKIVKFDDGLRAEVYTDDSTVVIFGMSTGQVDQALDELQVEDPNSPTTEILKSDVASQSLEAPDRGSMQGESSCVS